MEYQPEHLQLKKSSHRTGPVLESKLISFTEQLLYLKKSYTNYNPFFLFLILYEDQGILS